MNRQITISIVGFVLIVSLGFYVFSAMTSKKQKESEKINFNVTKYVQVQSVEYTDNRFVLSANGRLKSNNKMEVYSEVQGIMDANSLDFKIGNSFKKGQVLIKIDDEEYKLQLITNKSEYLNLLAMAMPDIKTEFPQEFNKWNNFLENIEINKQLPELPVYDSGKEKYFIASRKILGQYYNIKNMEIKLNKYVIKAPFDGIITSSLIEPGTLIRPGQKLGEFAGIGNYELELSLNQEDASLISKGNSVIIDNNGSKLNATVLRKSSSIDPTTQTIKIFVQVSGDNLSDGMYMKANITGQVIPNSMMITRNALINNKFVYINNNGKLDKKEINLLANGSENVYINGLEEGTSVITMPLVNPSLGMQIEPIK